jgi:hypothetical protein
MSLRRFVFAFTVLGMFALPTALGAPGGRAAAPTPTWPPGVHLRIDHSGDVNCDSETNSIDVALIMQRSAGLLATIACGFHGDVSHDLHVDSIDATIILQWIAGLLRILPP